MRALANDREITATLGVPVRRVEAAAWFGSGIVCGMAGLLLPDLLTSLDYSALTFLVISSLAAALIGRLRSLWMTLFGGLAVGVVQAVSPRTRGSRRSARSAATARRRRSCSRSSRCCTCRAAASSRSRGPPTSGLERRTGTERAARRPAACSRVDRGMRRPRAVVVGRPARRSRCSALPAFVGADWITTFTSVAIYSVVALGFGLLYGRVGMISLGQVALLSIGCWIGTRLAYGTSMPFPLLLIVVGAITVR